MKIHAPVCSILVNEAKKKAVEKKLNKDFYNTIVLNFINSINVPIAVTTLKYEKSIRF